MDRENDRTCFKMRVIEYHDYRTLMGPCFVSFSLPLLVPGVVLTVVGSYGNEHTFPSFSGWHITGIVILTIATLMLLVGIFLKCFFRPVVSADLEEHLTPSNSMVTGEKNLGHGHDIYTNSNSSSTGSRNNKVGPTSSSVTAHRVVSTHDTRDRTPKQPAGRTVTDANSGDKDNCVITQEKNTGTENSSGTIEDNLDFRGVSVHAGNTGEKHSNDDTETHTRDQPHNVPGPPTYNEAVSDRSERKVRRKHSKDRHAQSGVDPTEPETEANVTVVQSSVSTEVEYSTERHDVEPDNDTFGFAESRHEKKRRKKKKRRDSRRSVQDDDANRDCSNKTVIQLPDLRIKPALHNEEYSYRHHDQHVQFQSEDNSSDTPLNVRESQDFENI